ncbi:MAG: alpha/beta hydrolase [Ignisphaera sp.]|uniref:Alpha/beta hydrolase n=1 Tax=Ignisphaera aggregans TaxID=334771 RepID=A0A7J3I851_9CREN
MSMDGCIEDLRFIEFDGFRLASTIHRPAIATSSAVLMLHGFTGNRIEVNRLYVDIARRLCSEGMAVLRLDYRGHGESSLPFEEFKIGYALEDGGKALEVLQKLFNPVRIGVVGFSLGGYVAIHLASRYRGAISSLALLAPGIKMDELATELARKLSLEGDFYIVRALKIRREGIESMIRSPSAMIYADTVDIPVLIIHAKNDSAVPYIHSIEFYEKIRSQKKRIVILDEGGHTFELHHIRDRVIEEVVAWFRETLLYT